MSSVHPRLAAVFASVRDVSPAERLAILDRECAKDAALRLEVEALLAQRDATPQRVGKKRFLLDGPPVASAAAIVDQLVLGPSGRGGGTQEKGAYEPGTIIDCYTLVKPVGSGAYGVVYLARQSLPEARDVALKILERHTPSERGVLRFEEERRALARMDHPGIANIYSGGITSRGHPYFAMEFLAGASTGTSAPRITEYADHQTLSVRERIELIILVCHAVEHAHQQRIIHRDLKPSNILVAHRGGKATPKVIDFGIARQLCEDEAEQIGSGRTPLTLTGAILGTPVYMSPEQAAGRPVDTRTDVYSLGVVLYELLCGVPPFPLDETSGPIDEHLRAIRLGNPTTPSVAVVRAQRSTTSRVSDAAADPRRLARSLRGDLDTIALKLLEKDPARRYQSAGALADDLQRYLTNQPIQARSPTRWYTLAKFARRHRGIVVVAAIVFAALSAATIVSLLSRQKATRAEQEARVLAADAAVRAAQFALVRNDGADVARWLGAVPRLMRGWEWGHLNARSDRSIHQLEGHEARLTALAISLDGRTLLSGGEDGTVIAWDAITMEKLGPSPARHTGEPGQRTVWSLACSPSGDRFATGTFDGSAGLRGFDGSLVRRLTGPDGKPYGTVYAVAFSSDGRWLAVGGGHPHSVIHAFVATHDAVTGANAWIDDTTDIHTASITDLAFSRDGRWLATASDDKSVCLWSLEGTKPAAQHVVKAGSEVNAVAFSPNSLLLAVGTLAREIELYEVPSLGKPLRSGPPLRGHRAPLASLAFSPDGTWLASASWDSTIRLWKMPDGGERAVLRGHRSRVNRVVFASDQRLISASNDKTIREWSIPHKPDVSSLRVGTTQVYSIKFLATGTLAVSCLQDCTSVWDPRTGTKLAVAHPACAVLTVSHDGSTLAGVLVDAFWTWRAGAEAIVHPCAGFRLRHETDLLDMDDERVLVACESGRMQLDLLSNSWRRIDSNPDYPIGGLLCTTIGHAVVWNQDAENLTVFDTRTGTRVTLGEQLDHVWAAAFSRDHSRLASVEANTLRIWDWQREREVLTLEHPERENDADSEPQADRFRTVAWSHDGKTIATGSTNGVIHLWASKFP